MTETTKGYVGWAGQTSTARRILTVAADQIGRVRTNTWAFLAVGAGMAWGVASSIELYQLRQAGEAPDFAGFFDMLDQLLWFALAAAAVIGAPALLEDQRRGALELYLSRPLSQLDYLAGKAIALFALCLSIFAVPILTYTVTAYGFFDQQPVGWTTAPWAGLGYGFLWSVTITGLALGISCAARSGRAAAILLFGGAVVFHILAANILPNLTESAWLSIFSPFEAMAGIQPWLFPANAPAGDFPAWWGLTEILALAAIGWAFVWWRHPKPRGA